MWYSVRNLPCRGKSVCSLMCVGKLLPRRNCLNSMLIFGQIIVEKNLHFSTLFEQTPIMAIINSKKKMKEKTKKVWSMVELLVGME